MSLIPKAKPSTATSEVEEYSWINEPNPLLATDAADWMFAPPRKGGRKKPRSNFDKNSFSYAVVSKLTSSSKEEQNSAYRTLDILKAAASSSGCPQLSELLDGIQGMLLVELVGESL